jgi:hypothetical protein
MPDMVNTLLSDNSLWTLNNGIWDLSKEKTNIKEIEEQKEGEKIEDWWLWHELLIANLLSTIQE